VNEKGDRPWLFKIISRAQGLKAELKKKGSAVHETRGGGGGIIDQKGKLGGACLQSGLVYDTGGHGGVLKKAWGVLR